VSSDTVGGGEVTVVRELAVTNPLGFHARPATLFARLAAQFDSEITVEKDGTTVSGKSLMGLLSLEAGQGTSIIVTAVGEDADESVERLEELVKDQFGMNESS
jgi:phosphocarrier protein HPr